MYNVQFQNPSFGPPPPHRQQQSPRDPQKSQPVMSRTNPPPSPKPYASTSTDPRSSYETMIHPTPTLNHPSTGTLVQEGQTVGRKEQGNMYYAAQDVDQWTVNTNSTAMNANVTVTGDHSYPGKAPDAAMLSPTSSGSLDDEYQQQNMQQIFEKKRRRRESHNAVERRRRDNINERINELATLLPDRDATKANKGTVLRKSVDHIRILHDRLNKYQHRIQELEGLLGMYRMREHPDAGATMMPAAHPIDLTGHMNSHDPFRRGR